MHILRIAYLASQDQVLELANVERVAFRLVDLLDDVPQDLYLFLFGADLVSKVVYLLRLIGCLLRAAVR